MLLEKGNFKLVSEADDLRQQLISSRQSSQQLEKQSAENSNEIKELQREAGSAQQQHKQEVEGFRAQAAELQRQVEAHSACAQACIDVTAVRTILADA